MRFNIHEAKTQFSKIVAAVEAGETVVICRNGKPVIACAPVPPERAFPLGAWGPPPARGEASGDHLVQPTDDDLLDGMGL